MPNNSSTNHENFRLIDYVTPQIDGLVWVSDESLLERPHLFQEVDYLCNGQLTKLSLQLTNLAPEKKLAKGPHLIFTEQFGSNFFVCQIQNQGAKETEKALKQTLRTQFPASEQKGMTLLLIDRTGKDLASPLKKDFPNVEFKILHGEDF